MAGSEKPDQDPALSSVVAKTLDPSLPGAWEFDEAMGVHRKRIPGLTPPGLVLLRILSRPMPDRWSSMGKTADFAYVDVRGVLGTMRKNSPDDTPVIMQSYAEWVRRFGRRVPFVSVETFRSVIREQDDLMAAIGYLPVEDVAGLDSSVAALRRRLYFGGRPDG